MDLKFVTTVVQMGTSKSRRTRLLAYALSFLVIFALLGFVLFIYSALFFDNNEIAFRGSLLCAALLGAGLGYPLVHFNNSKANENVTLFSILVVMAYWSTYASVYFVGTISYRLSVVLVLMFLALAKVFAMRQILQVSGGVGYLVMVFHAAVLIKFSRVLP